MHSSLAGGGWRSKGPADDSNGWGVRDPPPSRCIKRLGGLECNALCMHYVMHYVMHILIYKGAAKLPSAGDNLFFYLQWGHHHHHSLPPPRSHTRHTATSHRPETTHGNATRKVNATCRGCRARATTKLARQRDVLRDAGNAQRDGRRAWSLQRVAPLVDVRCGTCSRRQAAPAATSPDGDLA